MAGIIAGRGMRRQPPEDGESTIMRGLADPRLKLQMSEETLSSGAKFYYRRRY